MQLDLRKYLSQHPRLKKFLLIFSIGFIGLYLSFRLMDKLFPLPLERLNYSTVVLASDGSVLSAYLSADEKWRIKIEKEDIPTSLKKAFLFKEDKHFYHHFGINPVSLIRAFFQDIKAGKVVSGASTITMQVARMLCPERRTFKNKFKEMFRALQLESRFSKEQILEMYFNLLPYGGNVEGIKAASIIYLHKLPVNLSTAEIATLMIIPNNPNKYKFGIANNTIIAARNKWLERFDKGHVFPDREVQQGLTEPLAAKRMEISKIAPHLCNRLSEKIKDVPYIHTNIDFNAEKRTQQILTEYVRKLTMWNITNAAAIIIRNKDHAVVAYVGSANYDDVQHQGQVDGVNALRSLAAPLNHFFTPWLLTRDW